MPRDDALRMAGALLALALIPALWPMSAAAAPEERDAICQGYRGTALWGECTRAVDNGCDESDFAHPRCERWAQQWRDRTGAEPPWLLLCGDSFGSKCVFVTSGAYSGNLIAAANSSLGTSFTAAQALAAGDALCQHHAESEGSLAAPGIYKAWLSNFSGSPATGFTRATVPYHRVDGTVIANGWDDLSINRTLEAPIDRDEAGNPVSPSTVWTNTHPDGVFVLDGTGVACAHFTSGASILIAAVGATNGTEANWTNWFLAPCNESRRLYCFQQ